MTSTRTRMLVLMFFAVTFAYAPVGQADSHPQPGKLDPGASLGPLDLQRYCAALGFIRSSSWNCVAITGELVPINMRDACNFRYRGQRGVAICPNDDPRFDPSKWICVVEDVVRLKQTSELPPGVYRIGEGVAAPRVIANPKPHYTVEALRARIQGSVLVECVVERNGLCTDIQIARSLDSTFGLDEQAVGTVREWRFAPGTHLGVPVPVLVTIEITFKPI